MEILVDENGYKQFHEILDSLKKDLTSSSSSDVFSDTFGDGWHDNFAYEEAMREERSVAQKIKNMLDMEKHLKIVNDKKYEDKVNLDDTVELLFTYNDESSEKEIVKLTGKYMPNEDGLVLEISLNSPLGKVIYKKKIGDEVCYQVHGNLINVKIIEKKC